MGSLDLYRAKRDFRRTSEPAGRKRRKGKESLGGVFVIHKHAARRLHYDLRLEHGGVLWSWAVTRGPSLDPDEKRLAVHVEDHPLDYGKFEGVIPKGEYGAGAVIVWDEGRWIPSSDPAKGMAKGHIEFTLEGQKLRGSWHLVRLKPRRGEKRDNWLLMKAKDEEASDADILAELPASVTSGRTVEDVERGVAPKAGGANDQKISLRADKQKSSRKPTSVELPTFVEPCLATLKTAPVAGANWVHEVKFDGYRVQARIDHGKVRLLTRTGLDWTSRFGQSLAKAIGALPCETALIDGEIVVMAEGGISSFSALQAQLSEGQCSGLVYFAFDLLHLDGEDVRHDPLLGRKERLADLLHDADRRFVHYSEHFVEPGATMLEHACRMGLEGVISKRADAPYRSGRRGDWLKSKCVQSQEFVIAGYVPSKAMRNGIGSLVVGYHDGNSLKPVGRVGTGYTADAAAALKKRLDLVATKASSFDGKAAREKGIVWVKPDLVAEIEFRSWTADGMLRQASFKGLREDKPADTVIREDLVHERDAPARTGKLGGRASTARPVITNVILSNPGKVLWPDRGLTKQGLLDHYERVWGRMRPHVVGRPLSLLRAPDGIAGQTFFQKHAGPGLHPAVRRHRDKISGEELLFIEDFDGLAALVQLGVVEIHLWGATIGQIETPDQMIFDLDPGDGVTADDVRLASLDIAEKLRELDFTPFVKTSGGKGYHVTVPLKPEADWDAVKGFTRDFAKALEQSEPKRYTATLAKKARKGRIFVDYLRNGRGATAVAAYSTRARPGAPIAMPISWADLKRGRAPNEDRVGDTIDRTNPWSAFRRRVIALNRRTG
jgi:bifunctional non-homologous end joining protein LigD